MNYIKLINWFWEEVPCMDGYKPHYGILFMALVDSINANDWKTTEIEYDRLANKTKLDKRMYLEARKWLCEAGFIEVIPGKNEYSKARFTLKVEVHFSTTPASSDVPATHHTSTLHSTTPASSDVPSINKPKTLKQKTNISFEGFWKAYDYAKGKEKAKAKWEKLTDQERELAMAHVPAYVASTPEKNFRKHPSTYLNGKCWNDEIPASQADTTPIALAANNSVDIDAIDPAGEPWKLLGLEWYKRLYPLKWADMTAEGYLAYDLKLNTYRLAVTPPESYRFHPRLTA